MQKFSVLSFNIWGAPYAKHRSARMQLIGKKVVMMQPDVLLLQEVYMQNNRDDLLAILTDGGYDYLHYFGSSVVGSGLLTVSKYPIVSTHFLRFRMGGKPLMLEHGDYYAGKGIGLARININGTIVDCYNIHPHAQYEMNNDNAYAIYTHTNLYEATQFIHSHSADNPVIIGGDYNTRPDQVGYDMMLVLSDLQDSYTTLHNDDGITFSPNNVYVSSPAQRLDYVMIRAGKQQVVQPEACTIVMDESFSLADTGALQYSDHYGVFCIIRIDQAPGMIDSDVMTQDKQRILRRLHYELTDAVADTIREQQTQQTRALMSLGLVGDIWLSSGILRQVFPEQIQKLRRWGSIISVLMSLYFLLQARVNMEARRQTLEQFRDEIQWQIKAP